MQLLPKLKSCTRGILVAVILLGSLLFSWLLRLLKVGAVKSWRKLRPSWSVTSKVRGCRGCHHLNPHPICFSDWPLGCGEGRHACGLHVYLQGHHLLTALYDSDVLVYMFCSQFLAWFANLFVLLFRKNTNNNNNSNNNKKKKNSNNNNNNMIQKQLCLVLFVFLLLLIIINLVIIVIVVNVYCFIFDVVIIVLILLLLLLTLPSAILVFP